jgi:ornithine--oxo-acid transaminase
VGAEVATTTTSNTFDRPNANISLSTQAKPTHQNIIRLAPPLVISEEEIKTALKIIHEAVSELPTLKGKKEDEVLPAGEKHLEPGLEN